MVGLCAATPDANALVVKIGRVGARIGMAFAMSGCCLGGGGSGCDDDDDDNVFAFTCGLCVSPMTSIGGQGGIGFGACDGFGGGADGRCQGTSSWKGAKDGGCR